MESGRESGANWATVSMNWSRLTRGKVGKEAAEAEAREEEVEEEEEEVWLRWKLKTGQMELPRLDADTGPTRLPACPVRPGTHVLRTGT